MLSKAKSVFWVAAPALHLLTIRCSECHERWWSHIGRYEVVERVRAGYGDAGSTRTRIRVAAHEVLRPGRGNGRFSYGSKSTINHFTFVVKINE